MYSFLPRVSSSPLPYSLLPPSVIIPVGVPFLLRPRQGLHRRRPLRAVLHVDPRQAGQDCRRARPHAERGDQKDRGFEEPGAVMRFTWRGVVGRTMDGGAGNETAEECGVFALLRSVCSSPHCPPYVLPLLLTATTSNSQVLLLRESKDVVFDCFIYVSVGGPTKLPPFPG